MSRRPAIASAPVGERTPARERAEEAIRTAAAAALACLRAGDVAGAEAAIRSPELRSDSHARDARKAVKAALLDVTAGTHRECTDIGRDVRSLLHARLDHRRVLVKLERGAAAGHVRCEGCEREARLLKVWGRWHLVGSGDRRTDLTAGRCAGVRAA